MFKYAYVQITIPEGDIRTIEEIEEQTGGKVHYMSMHSFEKQLLFLEDRPEEMISELESRGYTVTKTI